MKTKILVLTFTSSAVLALAQSQSALPPTPPTPGSTTPGSGGFGRTNQFRLGNFGTTTFTNSLGETFSPEQIELQLTELRTAVNQLTPALHAITEVYSNSAAGSQTGVAGSIAGVLGGVLNRDTNNATGQASTNTLGRILRDAISAATTNATTTNVTQLRDFVALQTQLQAINPIFDRLGVSSNAVPVGIGGTDTNSPTGSGTGRGSGGNKGDNNNPRPDR